MHLGFICKVQNLLDKTSVLLEQHTPYFVLGKEGNIELLETVCIKGMQSFIWGQSPEDLDFVHSLLSAKTESGNMKIYKIKAKPNPRETSLDIYPHCFNSGLDQCKSHRSLPAATAVHATVEEGTYHVKNCLCSKDPKNQA